MAIFLTELRDIERDCRRCLTRAAFLFSDLSDAEVDALARELQIPKIFNDRSNDVSVWIIPERWHKILNGSEKVLNIDSMQLESYIKRFQKT